MAIKQIHVRDFYNGVVSEHSSEIASRFYHNMVEWDGRKDVLNAFYDKDVLDMQLKFAIEDI